MVTILVGAFSWLLGIKRLIEEMYGIMARVVIRAGYALLQVNCSRSNQVWLQEKALRLYGEQVDQFNAMEQMYA